MSFSLDSCAPEPVCQSRTTNFNNMDRITSKTEYLGDSSKTDWVMDGQALPYNGDSVLLTMADGTVGTLLASSTYMWYGNVQATFKTSRGAGVVTAFILLSDVKDEIDYEFVGTGLETAQTNFYAQGVPNYMNSANITLSDTFDNFHTYEVDWTPDTITWKVDGQVGRTKKRSETWNATANKWDYPQTPARVQLSLWPGGLESNAQGTIDWAGGLVDWNSADIQNNGYYYAQFKSVSISCYNATKPPGTNENTSYKYNNKKGTNDTVVDGDDPTVLASFQATGEDMDAGKPQSSGTQSASKPSSTAESIPGLSGGGPGTDNHAGDSGSGSDQSSAVATIGSSPTDSSSGSASTGGSSGGDFDQGGGSNSGSSTKGSGAERLGQEKVLKGSVFAGIVAVVAMMAL